MAKISPRQYKAVEALVSGASASIAASYAGVTRKQIYVWLQNPDFQQAVRESSAEILSSTVNHLTKAAGDAVLVLQHAVRDTNQPMNVRIRAADMILTHLTNYRKLYEMEDRLRQLELRLEYAE